MKQLLDFLNESKGQRISLRGTNKPYNPDTDVLVQKRDNREERANKLRRDRKFTKIANLLEKFKQALKNISKDEILSDGYINIYLEYYDNEKYHEIQSEDMKYFNILKIDDIDKLNCWWSNYSLNPRLKYDSYDLKFGDNYVKIENEDFFDKHLFVYIGYIGRKYYDDNVKRIDTERFKSALSQYINKGFKYEGRIKASTLMDNPDLFMKAYEKIKERL